MVDEVLSQQGVKWFGRGFGTEILNFSEHVYESRLISSCILV